MPFFVLLYPPNYAITKKSKTFIGKIKKKFDVFNTEKYTIVYFNNTYVCICIYILKENISIIQF